jgi:methylmalonyl-CoA mutase N-terminal domain/subunit
MGVAKYIKDEKDAIKEVIYQSGIKIKPVYTPKDLEEVGFEYGNDLGDPGEYPFTRSLHPQGYRSRAWTTRQYTGFGTPQETNERFKLMISHGQTGLNVAFDLPTQMGYDSDDPKALGEIGRVGMAIDSLRDFEIAFDGIPLDRIGSGLTINAVAAIMLAMYQVTAEKSGYPKEKISATPQNDILKEMIGRGAWIFPVEHAVRLVGDSIEYSVRELPRCNPVSICGYHIRESGATPAQEVACAFEIAKAYIDNVKARGLAVEDFVGRFSFNLNVFGNLWEQIAKFRAARKLWAKMLKEEYGVQEKKKLFLRGLFGGGGSGLTKDQPENNIMRGAFYALGAALSGAQTTALCSFDEAYTIPTPRAALLSLRTLEIIMDEVGLRDTVQEVGGMVHAVASGFIQRKVAQQAYEYESGIQKGEYIKVGVNKYTEGSEAQTDVELHEYNEQWVDKQVASLKELRRTRDNREVTRLLKELEKCARDRKNVMPLLVDCCRAYATVGEMAGVFRDVFGEWQEPGIF